MDDFEPIQIATLGLYVYVKDGVEHRFVMASEPPAHRRCIATSVMTDIAVVASALEKLWEATAPQSVGAN